MSLRKSRKRRAAKRAAKAWTAVKLASPVGRVAKALTVAKVAKGAYRRAPGRRPLALAAGSLGGAVAVATVRRRRARASELPYGAPNESVPSHETLAPSRQAAGQAPVHAPTEAA